VFAGEVVWGLGWAEVEGKREGRVEILRWLSENVGAMQNMNSASAFKLMPEGLNDSSSSSLSLEA
jgi:hypothetical protein